MAESLLKSIGPSCFRGDNPHVTRSTDILQSSNGDSLTNIVTVQIDDRQTYDIIAPEGKTAIALISVVVRGDFMDIWTSIDNASEQFAKISKHFIAPVIEFVFDSVYSTASVILGIMRYIVNEIRDYLPAVRFIFDDVPPVVILSPLHYEKADYSHVAIAFASDQMRPMKDNGYVVYNMEGKSMNAETYGDILELIDFRRVHDRSNYVCMFDGTDLNPVRLVICKYIIFNMDRFDRLNCLQYINIDYNVIDRYTDLISEISNQLETIFIKNPHLHRLDIIGGTYPLPVNVIPKTILKALAEKRITIDTLTVGHNQPEDRTAYCANLVVMYLPGSPLPLISKSRCTTITVAQSFRVRMDPITLDDTRRHMIRKPCTSTKTADDSDSDSDNINVVDLINEPIPNIENLQIVLYNVRSCDLFPPELTAYGGYALSNSLNAICGPIPVDIHHPTEHTQTYSGSFVSIR